MSSAERYQRQIAPNALYVAVGANVSSLIRDPTGTSTVGWATGATAGQCAIGSLYRDMGKTIYVPSPNTPNALGSQSTIYRKVQLVPTSTFGLYGTGGAATGDNMGEFFTGYIPLGAQTYGGGAGGTGAATPYFARAN